MACNTLVLEVVRQNLIDMQANWPALATGQKEDTWDMHYVYPVFARLLLSLTLLRRSPNMPMARFALQKARAMRCAGLAHQFRVELICIRDLTGVRAATWMGGPLPWLGESDANWAPTAGDREQAHFALHCPDSDEETDEASDDGEESGEESGEEDNDGDEAQ
jgi:hypothetical protein